jgi:hypothetical protein
MHGESAMWTQWSLLTSIRRSVERIQEIIGIEA